MGKGIIFVGSTNLNRNSDQQSMYSKKGLINNDKLKKDFYVELRSYCLQNLNTKNRKKRITSLKNKHGTFACSEKNMEKVFEAYNDWLKNCKRISVKSRKNDIRNFFEKHHVDKRIQKRLFEIEGIHTQTKLVKGKSEKNKPSKNSTNAKKSNSKRQPKLRPTINKNQFYEQLHNYMDIFYNIESIPLYETINNGINYYGKDEDFIKSIRELYSYKYSTNLSINQICVTYNINISKEDINSLQRYWTKN